LAALPHHPRRSWLGFAEALVGAKVHVVDPLASDNCVIEQRRPDDGCRVGDGAGERDVLVARRGIAAYAELRIAGVMAS